MISFAFLTNQDRQVYNAIVWGSALVLIGMDQTWENLPYGQSIVNEVPAPVSWRSMVFRGERILDKGFSLVPVSVSGEHCLYQPGLTCEES